MEITKWREQYEFGEKVRNVVTSWVKEFNELNPEGDPKADIIICWGSHIVIQTASGDALGATWITIFDNGLFITDNGKAGFGEYSPVGYATLKDNSYITLRQIKTMLNDFYKAWEQWLNED